MSTELYWMTLTVLMTALFWVPYVLDRTVKRGLVPMLADKRAEAGQEQSLWAQRARQAHLNAVENLVIFVPAVLVLNALNLSTPMTRAAVVVYFFARLAHFLVYAAGIPTGRTLAFTLAWLSQIALFFTILGWV
jgi:uncharacterized MAPEG superfamily protein